MLDIAGTENAQAVRMIEQMEHIGKVLDEAFAPEPEIETMADEATDTVGEVI